MSTGHPLIDIEGNSAKSELETVPAPRRTRAQGGQNVMTCQEIMDSDPPVLLGTDTVSKALDLFLERRYLALPVVDNDRHYLGLFAKSRLFGLMLPSIVALEDLLPKIARLTDLAYFSDDLDDLRERFRELAKRRQCAFAAHILEDDESDRDRGAA